MICPKTQPAGHRRICSLAGGRGSQIRPREIISKGREGREVFQRGGQTRLEQIHPRTEISYVWVQIPAGSQLLPKQPSPNRDPGMTAFSLVIWPLCSASLSLPSQLLKVTDSDGWATEKPNKSTRVHSAKSNDNNNQI